MKPGEHGAAFEWTFFGLKMLLLYWSPTGHRRRTSRSISRNWRQRNNVLQMCEKTSSKGAYINLTETTKHAAEGKADKLDIWTGPDAPDANKNRLRLQWWFHWWTVRCFVPYRFDMRIDRLNKIGTLAFEVLRGHALRQGRSQAVPRQFLLNGDTWKIGDDGDRDLGEVGPRMLFYQKNSERDLKKYCKCWPQASSWCCFFFFFRAVPGLRPAGSN